ncbi:hypothetical protein H0H92_011833, partial [Tricholoma furcatifolium]
MAKGLTPVGPVAELATSRQLTQTLQYATQNNFDSVTHSLYPALLPTDAITDAIQGEGPGEDDDDDDGFESNSDGAYDTPSEPETRAQRNIREAKKAKQGRRRETEKAQKAAFDRKWDSKNPGTTPSGWMTKYVGGRYERSNSFNGMLHPEFYWDSDSNIVFVGYEARNAVEAFKQGQQYRSNLRMYEAAPRGMPMAPAEVSALARIATGKRRDATDMDKVYAHRMLDEFDRITKAVGRDMRDRSMQAIRTTNEWKYNVPPNCPDCPAWKRVTWDISRSAQMSRDLTGKTRGAGLPMVEGKHALNITKWCQYIMHHCYPGSPNVFSGAAMDLSLRVDRRSVFGMLLCRALAPHKGRNHFIRQFAMTVASPGLYREAIRDYNDRFPSEPFEPLPLIPGATIRLRKLKASL